MSRSYLCTCATQTKQFFLRVSKRKVKWSGKGRQGVFGSLFSSLLQPFDWLRREFLSFSSSLLHPYPSFIHSFILMVISLIPAHSFSTIISFTCKNLMYLLVFFFEGNKGRQKIETSINEIFKKLCNGVFFFVLWKLKLCNSLIKIKAS